ncbi:MAG: arginine deiminase family protein [Comamonadaceae bacterium]|nr:arginine deiminase family protein [Comamonadaceae bacterium]
MPNLYFTRDPFSVIGSGVAVSRMFAATRSRETIYGEYIFNHHPVYGNPKPSFYYRRDLPSTIEGGDILLLTPTILAVGVSQRTHPAAIEKLAKNLFYTYPTPYEKIVAFDIPKSRSFMHLDTVLTQVDVDKFTIHNELNHTIKVFELTKNPESYGKLLVKPIERPLKATLENVSRQARDDDPVRRRRCRRLRPRAVERRSEHLHHRPRRSHRLPTQPRDQRHPRQERDQDQRDPLERTVARDGVVPVA